MTNRAHRPLPAFLLLAVALAPGALSAQTPSLYAKSQAEQGEKVFAASCASCHGADLEGKDDAPPLAGPYFASSWGGHKVSELIDFVQGNMPFDGPGKLDADSYLRVVAYLLARNGLPAGETPLAKGATGSITVAPQQASRVSASFDRAPIHDVLAFFARYSGRSIVAGVGVAATVSAEIKDQPWDVALAAVLTAQGLTGRELPSGIILVENPETVVEQPGRLVSRVFRLSYTPAAEAEEAVRSMLTERGTVSVVTSINALVVTDEERVLARVASVLGKS